MRKIIKICASVLLDFMAYLERRKKTMTFKEYRSMKVYEQSGYQYKATPTITLKGPWLKDCGFDMGTPITVKCEGDRLTITRADEFTTDYRKIVENQAVSKVAESTVQ